MMAEKWRWHRIKSLVYGVRGPEFKTQGLQNFSAINWSLRVSLASNTLDDFNWNCAVQNYELYVRTSHGAVLYHFLKVNFRFFVPTVDLLK